MGERHVARHRHVAATDEANVGDGVVRRPEGTTVATAARAPMRPATRWMHVVSRASVRLTAGRMVVSRRASIDLPAPGGPSRRTLWSERLHDIQLYVAISTSQRITGHQPALK
jgi:hypothetical protein